jgi:aminoglycoside phosphotransferase (APT) family kinase protein
MTDPTANLPSSVRAAWDAAGLGDIDAAEPIKHGLTNDSWLVRREGGTFVVRFSSVSEDVLQIDRASEARILTAAAEAGVGAPVVACEPQLRLLVTRYVGPVWSQELPNTTGGMAAIVRLLHRVHTIALPGIRVIDLLESARGYAIALREQGQYAALVHEGNLTRAADAAATMRSGRPCLCHNDIHHLNIVGEQPHLIDWEYAGNGEPLVDLASIAVYQGYRAEQRGELLALYLRRHDVDASRRLEAACWLFDYVRELWLAVRSLDTASEGST